MKKYYDTDIDSGGVGATPPANLPTIGAAPIVAVAPSTVRPIPINNAVIPTPRDPRLIPKLNYSDPASHVSFLNNWQKQYGNLEGRGDTVLKVDQVPRGASDTMKNISTKYGKQYGVDPALLYSSAMEEGASGLFKDLNGKDTKGRKPGDFGYQDYYGDKAFPINGGQSFGFQTFAERFPDLVKGGYLPKEFASQFRGVKAAQSSTSDVEDANNFKTPEAAMQAKAAMIKYHYDDVDSYAKQRKITLSPKARDFFAMAEYNAGEGTGHNMLNDYYNNGYLEGDKFLDKRPTTGKGLKASSYGPVMMDGKEVNEGVYNHIARRLKMAGNLKEQKLFE